MRPGAQDCRGEQLLSCTSWSLRGGTGAPSVHGYGQRNEPGHTPQREPYHRRRPHPVPQRQGDRPETVDEEEHPTMAAIIIDACGDACAEDQRGNQTEDDVEDMNHVRYRTSITLRTT